jgi:hypothetical protein
MSKKRPFESARAEADRHHDGPPNRDRRRSAKASEPDYRFSTLIPGDLRTLAARAALAAQAVRYRGSQSDRVAAINALMTGGESLRRRSFRVLDVWSAILPSRIVNEDLGDYLEDIALRVAHGQRTLIYVRVGAAIFWTGVNAVGYVMKHVLGRPKAT